MFLKAEPQRTGTTSFLIVAVAKRPSEVALCDVLLGDVLLHDRVVVGGQDVDEQVPGLVGLARSMSAGIGSVRHFSPMSSSQMSASMARRSTMPQNPPSTPIGSWMTAGVGVEPVPDHLDGAIEVRADAVHLVDEADAGHLRTCSPAARPSRSGAPRRLRRRTPRPPRRGREATSPPRP